MRPLFWKALLGLTALVAALVLWGQMKRAFLNQGKTIVQVSDAKAAVAHADTVFVHDTVIRHDALARYRATVQPILLGNPTPGEAKIITLADTVIAADSTALADCDSVLAAKDSLLHLVTRKAPQPFVTPFAEALYAPQQDGVVVLRAGLTTRPVLDGFQLEVAGESSTTPRLYIGVRKTF